LDSEDLTKYELLVKKIRKLAWATLKAALLE
jgi:hypothetical protein